MEGSNRKNHPWEGYGYFLESHITKNMPSGLNFSKLITIFQKQFEKKGFALSLILKVRGNGDVTKTGNGERGAGNGERGTEVWERVVSGNLHKNPIWPMIPCR